MIVITHPSLIKDEIRMINSLFDEGLSLLHIRKPDFTALEMAQFIRQIKVEFRANLVLHSHHELAGNFKINRIHFSEKDRKSNLCFPAKFSKPFGYQSTATHSIEDFNSLEKDFDYAFLSPVYSSISKVNYHPKTNLFDGLKLRTNFNTKIVALGGIQEANIEETLRKGFDDFALLGTIWNSPNPIKNFKLCQKIALSLLA